MIPYVDVFCTGMELRVPREGPLGGDWSDGKTVLGMEWLFGNLVIDGCAAFCMQMRGPLVDWSHGRAVDSWFGVR